MAYLQKRGKTYYARFTKQKDGVKQELKISLKTQRREIAEKKLFKIDRKLEKEGIDPFSIKLDIDSLLIEDDDYVPLDLTESLQLFLDSRRHRKKITRDGYEFRVSAFLRFCGLQKKSFYSVNRQHFSDYLFRPGVGTTTRYTDRRHLRSWWHFCMKKGWAQKDLISDIQLPEKDATIVPKMITESELETLFKTFDQEIKEKRKNTYHRDYFEQPWFKPLLILLMDCGLRLHEAVYNPDQADTPEQNYTGLRGKNLIGELEYIYIDKAKRNRERLIPTTPRLRKYLQEYLNVRGYPGQDEFLFITYRNEPIKGHHARVTFKYYLKKAGIPKARTFHGMRHRAITTWLEDGFTLSEAKDMAGHSSVKITDEVYTHLAAKNLKRKRERIESMKNEQKQSRSRE